MSEKRKVPLDPPLLSRARAMRHDPAPAAEKVASAVDILRRGGIVAFPTETVYGLGADATNAQAIARVFQIKGRPATNPLIVHVADESVARRYARTWPLAASRIAERSSCVTSRRSNA